MFCMNNNFIILLLVKLFRTNSLSVSYIIYIIIINISISIIFFGR